MESVALLVMAKAFLITFQLYDIELGKRVELFEEWMVVHG